MEVRSGTYSLRRNNWRWAKESQLLQNCLRVDATCSKNKRSFQSWVSINEISSYEIMNLLLGVQSTFDLSKVDFSSGLGINSPDLAGISFLMVIFAGVLALRLGTTLRDS